MKKFLTVFLVLMVFALNAFAISGTYGIPQPSDVRTLLNQGGSGNLFKSRLGYQLEDKKVQVMKGKWDFAVQGGASAALVNRLNLKDVDGKDAVLPINSVIKQVIVDVQTVPVQSGAANFWAPIMSLGVNTDTDLKAALAASSYTGRLAGTPVGTAATAVKTLGNSAVYVTLTGGSVVSGKFNVFIEYYLSE